MTDRRHNGMLLFAIAVVVVVVVAFVVEFIGGKGDRLAALGGIIGGAVGAGGAAFAVWWQMNRRQTVERGRVLAAKAALFDECGSDIWRLLRACEKFLHEIESLTATEPVTNGGLVHFREIKFSIEPSGKVWDIAVDSTPELVTYVRRLTKVVEESKTLAGLLEADRVLIDEDVSLLIWNVGQISSRLRHVILALELDSAVSASHTTRCERLEQRVNDLAEQGRFL